MKLDAPPAWRNMPNVTSPTQLRSTRRTSPSVISPQL